MASPQANQTTVLVADSDPGIRESLLALLEEDGYAVLETADGLATLDLLRSDTRQFVVLLDQHLPKLDGISLLRHVARDRRLRKRHPFILMTTKRFSTRLATLRFLATLQVQLVHKPFNIEQIEEAVARAAAVLRTNMR